AVTLDPDFRLFRRLDAEELPPILRQIMLAPDAVTILLGHDAAVRGAALELAMRLLESPPRLLDPGAPSPVVPRLVIGLDRDVDDYVRSAGLSPRPADLTGRATARVWSARQQGKTVVVVSGNSAEAIAALRGPLPHYGRQSYLAFDGARMVQQGVWPARSPEWRFAVE
ncbi:MAG TPA: hypothetical protein VMG58_14075, partial [Candidatus Sulfotelmatobacter sp.]|nr:hypothetical protein [Candidatus Sulfotelmatobacter sp.]